MQRSVYGSTIFRFISGIVYVLVGILGFIPGMVATPGAAPQLAVNAGYGYLMGLFPINVLHNIVHLAVGFWGLLSYRRYSSARTYCRGLAIFYGLLTIMGFLPVLNTTFGLIPIFGHDIWLHAVTALIAAYFGFTRTRSASGLRDDGRLSM
ncbi:DUF4383 domain-containing protein [Leptolyngbya sp. GB1-A1]|uniref:DUF4383 domain-containing protein n=1 Tax=unclassified Leptolyngbya TaxID=2650499 RepID=UPI003299405D